MSWSVRDLLDFSYCPGINEAYEGDPQWDNSTLADTSLGLGWLDEGGIDANNNGNITDVHTDGLTDVL